jgi:hypothetical protein
MIRKFIALLLLLAGLLLFKSYCDHPPDNVSSNSRGVGISCISGIEFTKRLGYFSASELNGNADIRARIDWGDNEQSDGKIVVEDDVAVVVGTHRYAVPGNLLINITITRASSKSETTQPASAENSIAFIQSSANILLTRLQAILLCCVAVLSAIPVVSGRFLHFLDRFRHPSPARRRIVAMGLGVGSIAYFIFSAFRQHRALYPRFHDEHMYLLQMRLMSSFRLWTAPPHNPDFFDSFHMLVKPVYASIYFPGTALMYLWELWLHAPIWIGPVIAAGAIVALAFRIASELLDDAVLGLVTALLLLGVLWFRYLSMVIMSHSVIMLLGLAMMWAYLRWRKSPSLSWAAVIGVLAGWSAITRPVDAICYATPVAIAMLLYLFKHDRKRFVATAATIVVASLPLLSLQLILDKGVTGHFLKTPYQLYNNFYAPNLAYGTRSYNPTAVPQTVVQQKIVYDEFFNKTAAEAAIRNSPVKSWFDWKFYQLLNYGFANPLLVILFPIALLDLDRRRPRLLAGVLPMYMLGYAFFAFLLPHYCVVPSPAIAFIAVMGVDALRRIFPSLRASIETFFVLGLIVLPVASCNEFTGRLDDHFATTTMRAVTIDMPKVVHAPAVVLFHYNDRDDYNQEPVYNLDTVNIDDEPIIRAHDLGPQRNPELFDYYAKHQPDRMFYLFDRATSQITPMGTARELAAKFPLNPAS